MSPPLSVIWLQGGAVAGSEAHASRTLLALGWPAQGQGGVPGEAAAPWLDGSSYPGHDLFAATDGLREFIGVATGEWAQV